MTIQKSDKTLTGYKHRTHRAHREKIDKKEIEMRAFYKRRKERIIVDDFERQVKTFE